jgi:hypothetical protein
MFVHHVINQITGRDGYSEATEAVDDHQHEAPDEKPSERLDEVPDLGHHFGELWLGAHFSMLVPYNFASAARSAVSGLHTAVQAGWTEGRNHRYPNAIYLWQLSFATLQGSELYSCRPYAIWRHSSMEDALFTKR